MVAARRGLIPPKYQFSQISVPAISNFWKNGSLKRHPCPEHKKDDVLPSRHP
jgi:hypothetical protein